MPNYIKHTVIAKFKKYKDKTSLGVRTCTLLQSFEKENGIVFALSSWDGSYHPEISMKLSYNGKFNFYKTFVKVKSSPRISDFSKISCRCYHRIGKIKHNGLAKSQKLRIYRLIRDFCKKKGVSIKYLSKDPETLIKQLCYPGLIGLNNITDVRTGKCGKFAKTTNVVKSVFNTNGSLTKKLYLDIINEYPCKFEEITLLCRTIKQLFGLDKLQDFLKTVDFTNVKSLYHVYDRLSLTQVIKLYKGFFSRFSYNKVKILFSDRCIDNGIWPDTVKFITENNVVIPEFTGIIDLHDKCATQLNKQKKAKLLLEKSKNIEVPGAFRDVISKWNSQKYELVYPKDGLDLVEWSELMRNCVSTYENQIRAGTYYIVGIKESGVLKYNIGFTVNKITSSVKNTSSHDFGTRSPTISTTTILLSQMVGKSNSRIEPDVSNELTDCFNNAGLNIEYGLF